MFQIAQNPIKPPGSDADFCISNEISEITEDDCDEVFSIINSLDIKKDGQIYVPIVQYLAIGQTSVIFPIIIQNRLEEEIQKTNPDSVHILSDVEPIYQAVIEDTIDENTKIISDISNSKSTYRRIITYFSIFAKILYILMEHLILALLPSTEQHETDIVFVRHRAKSESIDPVISETYGDYVVVSPDTKLRHIWIDTDYPSITDYINLKAWWDEVVFYKHLLKTVYLSDEFSQKIATKLESNHEIAVPRTLNWVINDIFTSNTAEKFRYRFLTQSLISRVGCNSLVVSTLSPSGRAILQAAQENGVDAYHVPHSVITPYFSSVEGTQHFVCGELDMLYLKQLPQITDLDNFLPYGRPYFYELNRNWETKPNNRDHYLIVIATQPTDYRFEFIQSVLTAIEQSSLDVVVEIKIHPGESADDYQEYTARNNGKIRIATDQLFERLSRADLVVTKNSNVGFEGMIMGTPCIGVNYWSPKTRLFSYQIYGPVPVYRDESSLQNFFANINKQKLDKIGNKQKYFAEKTLQLSENPAKKIAKAISEKGNTSS